MNKIKNIQKVINNTQVKKVLSLWEGMNKKVKYGILAGAIALIIILIFSLVGGNGKSNTVVIEGSEDIMIAMRCENECKAGYVGYSYGTLYFKADDYTTVYLMESEDGNSVTTTAEEGDIYGRAEGYDYDGKLMGADSDSDGYIEFTISKFDGEEYDKVCTVRCKQDF